MFVCPRTGVLSSRETRDQDQASFELGLEEGEKRDLANREEQHLFWGWDKGFVKSCTLNASDWEVALTQGTFVFELRSAQHYGLLASGSVHGHSIQYRGLQFH